MPSKFFFRTCLFLMLTLLGSLSYAVPLLNGIAVHQELGREQFLGALYAESPSSDPETLITSKIPKRMELKIVSPDGMPTRRFGRMWIEGMAINNSNAMLTAQADNMVKFDGLFKGKLLENDHIVFAVTPNSGVSVSVNNILLGNIADDQFFEMLLRTWIGRVPLSSTYREALLRNGDVANDLRARYEGIKFNQARATAITAWNTTTTEPAQQTAARKEQPTSKPEPVIDTPKVSVPAISAPKFELPALEQPGTAPTEIATTTAEPTTGPAPTVPAAEPIAAVIATEEMDEEDNDEPALTAQSLLARQFYVSDMLKKIQRNTKYPRRAQDRNQEGGMRISIKIDRYGNIQEMAWLEESKYGLLNKEAWEAVKRSAPFPPIPDAMSGRSFEFTAPISFEMAR